MGADKNTLRFRNFPHAQGRYKNKTLLIIKCLQKEPWFLHFSEKLRKESDFRQNPGQNGLISASRVYFLHTGRNVVKPFEQKSFTK